jgi:hypothetical protein
MDCGVGSGLNECNSIDDFNSLIFRFSKSKTFKPEIGKRKEERGLPAFGGAKGDQG